MNNTESAKFNMIEQQIRPWEVLDQQVLSTIEQVNREDFVKEAYKGLAYADCQIPVSANVRMLPPNIEGRLLQALAISSEDEVLEIGSGSGYVTACLARMSRKVTSLDGNPDIMELARANTTAGGFDNIEYRQQTLTQIDADSAFDAITVNGSLPSIPNALQKALKIGGRLFVIVGQSPAMQALLVTRVSDSEFTTQSLFETDLPRLQS